MLHYVNAYPEAHASGPKPKQAETLGDLGSPPGLQAYLKSQVLLHRNGRSNAQFLIDTSNTLRRTYATITNMGQLLVPTRTPVPCRPSSVSATR